MKKSMLIVLLLFLSVFVFSSTAVAGTVGPRITSVSLSEADNYYSPCTGNNIAHITANVSNVVFVSANFSTIDAGIDCGSGNTVILTNTTANTWTGQCDLTAEAQNSNFNLAGPVIIVAADSGGHTDVNNSLIITLYNMTTPQMTEGCDRFGDETTNMCEVDDFSNVNFVTEIQTNGTCMSNQTGQQLPWTDYKTVVKFDFASIDMTGDGIGGRLAGLGNALQVYVTPPGQFGDSHISVNTSAFAELDTQATISVYGLPFTEEPAIYGEGDSISNIQYTLNEPYVITMSEEDCDGICDEECLADEECYDECMDECTATIVSTVPNADLTFTVGGFSQYNMTDEIQPTVTINSPEDKSTTQESITISATIDGTGSQISDVEFLINDETVCTYDQNEIYENCINETADWGIITCECEVAGLSEGENTIQVFGTDFGGEEGYTGSNTATITVDVLGCGDTITSDATLTEDLDCTDSGQNALTIGANGITLDCNGYTIYGNTRINGIYASNIRDATIKNCEIMDFDTGVDILVSNNLTIQNNTVTSNMGSGIYINGDTGTSDHTIIGNTVTNNAQDCIRCAGIVLYYEDNCLIQGNTISDNGNAGIYITNGNDNTVKENTIENNCEGARLEDTIANFQNNIFRDNTACTRTGLYVDEDSTAYVTNGEFIGNGEYGIYEYNLPPADSVYWTITDAAKCINNSVQIITGNITFDGGTLELLDCSLTLPDETGPVTINIEGTINNLDFDVQSVTSNTSTDFNFSESAVALTLSSDVTTTMAIAGETPGSSPTGFTALNGIDIIVDSTTDGALTSALIKIYYTHAQLTAANIAESSLKIYYYNISSGIWQYEAEQGVDSVNDYVWARVTHFSLFGTFGTAPPSGGYTGGGGGSSFYKKNTTSPITSATTIAPISFPCQDDWICDEWSACENGIQTRECGFNDYPECTRAASKPELQQVCESAKQETAWTSTGDQQEQSSVSDVIKQGITGAAAGAQYGMSALAKQVGIGIAVLVVIAGIAAYLLFLKK